MTAPPTLRRSHAALPILLLPMLVGACVSATAPAPAPGPRPAASARPTAPILGLQSVMGRNAAILQTILGRPELDVKEGTARKLQFTGPACVLDAYLYPPPRGGEPIVTHVDARLPDGRDMDRASCVAALTARPRTP